MSFEYPLSHFEKVGNIILRFGRGIRFFFINLKTMCSRIINPVVGPTGIPGPPGKSAYQVWLDLGNRGTVHDFLASLIAVTSCKCKCQNATPSLEIQNDISTEGKLVPRIPNMQNRSHTSELDVIGITYGMNIKTLFESWQQRHPTRSFQDFLDWISTTIEADKEP